MAEISEVLAALSEAVKATEYKYFGDYEFSDDQRKAVDTLVDAANAILSGQLVPVPSVERAWRDGFNAARQCLSDDAAYCLTADVEEDAWGDSDTRQALESLT